MSYTVITTPAPRLTAAPAAFAGPAPVQSRRERRLTALTAGLVFTIVAVSLLIVIVTADMMGSHTMRVKGDHDYRVMRVK